MKRDYVKPRIEIVAIKMEPMLSGTGIYDTAMKEIDDVATNYNRLGDGNQLGRKQQWLDDEDYE